MAVKIKLYQKLGLGKGNHARGKEGQAWSIRYASATGHIGYAGDKMYSKKSKGLTHVQGRYDNKDRHDRQIKVTTSVTKVGQAGYIAQNNMEDMVKDEFG